MKGKPVHLAYVVETINENEAFWTCIGAAFAHADRTGMTLVLRALPIGGRIVLRRYTEKPVSKDPLPEVESS
ncbi:MAG: hypothetical protein ABL908_05720 [Hyphomicrobium sp.]